MSKGYGTCRAEEGAACEDCCLVYQGSVPTFAHTSVLPLPRLFDALNSSLRLAFGLPGHRHHLIEEDMHVGGHAEVDELVLCFMLGKLADRLQVTAGQGACAAWGESRDGR